MEWNEAIDEAIRACEKVAAAKEIRRPGPFRGLHPDATKDGWEPAPPDFRSGAWACVAALKALRRP